MEIRVLSETNTDKNDSPAAAVIRQTSPPETAGQPSEITSQLGINCQDFL